MTVSPALVRPVQAQGFEYDPSVRFEKWQGLGNHYLVVHREEWPLGLTADRARLICDPNFGVGGDGILELDRETGTPRMTVWNPDGSHAENCGNGIRMVARHLVGRGDLTDGGTVLTGAGPVSVRTLDDGRVEVQMGRALFPDGEGRETLAVNGAQVDLAFVTTGIEYGWGHRVTATEAKGDSHTIQGLLRVSF